MEAICPFRLVHITPLRLVRITPLFQINVIHAHREILSKLPTLLRHKLQSKMAHFAALDSA